jgi:hypothetical protein
MRLALKANDVEPIEASGAASKSQIGAGQVLPSGARDEPPAPAGLWRRPRPLNGFAVEKMR